jgi:NitT/TauT family transport system substrate-binding protein
MHRIKVGVAHYGAGLAPVFAAVEGGYFREAGLDVELVHVHGHPKTIEAMLAGEVDFINSVGPELILANERHGGDAVVIASAISRSAQQVSARPGLKSREDLRGKRWGVTARKDMDECSIAMAFERWGWKLDDIEIVVVGSNGLRLDLLLDASKVDVAIMHAPETFQALNRGWELIEDLGRLDVSFQNSCAATTRRLLSDRRDLANRYVRAFCAGVHRFRTDPGFGISLLKKYTKEPDDEVIVQTWTLFSRLMGGMMFPSLEGLRNAAGVLRKLDAIKRAPDPFELADMAPMAALDESDFFATLLGARSVKLATTAAG